MTYYPEAEILPSALLEIIEDTMHLYDKMFNTSLGKQVKKIIQEEVLFKGKTGYNLKKDHKNRIPDFSSKLGSETLVDSKTEIGQWYQFFNREYPAQKINWIGTYNQLWYFIKEYSRSDFIKKHLHQKFKHVPKIFLKNGQDLEPDFFRNHNYLNEADSKKIDSIIDSLKQ